MKKFFVLLLFCVCPFLNAQTTWDYPIKPGTDEWAKLDTHEEKVEVSQIPDDVLTSLSTVDLYKLVIKLSL